MPETELWLVRHGETEWSANGRHTSVTDLELTDRGAQRALALRAMVRPGDFDLVLSSPRRRAIQTAEIAGFAGANAPEIVEDLAEWSYGEYEGLTSAEIREQVPGWTVFTHPTPGGETAEQIASRLDRVIARVRASGARRVLCFGHGHALRALMLRWLGFELSLGGHFPLETGTVSVLGEEKNLPSLERWNVGLLD